MDDEAEDTPLSEVDISQWAANLTPDGAPGLMAQRMREYFGDAGYEKVVAQNDAATALHLQRETLINSLLSVASLSAIAFGSVGFVAAVLGVLRSFSRK